MENTPTTPPLPICNVPIPTDLRPRKNLTDVTLTDKCTPPNPNPNNLLMYSTPIPPITISKP